MVPDHRQAAQEHSSTTGRGGPNPIEREIGKIADAGVSPVLGPMIHPWTLRPWSGTRTRLPASVGPVKPSGTL